MNPWLLWGMWVAGTDLEALLDQARQYPEDYATVVALGEAALAAAAADPAVEAWQRAVELSNGNFESRRGLVLALTLAGAHPAAIDAAEALVADHPHNAQAWAVHAWAWRWNPTWPQRSAVRAVDSYENALEQGALGDVPCGLGWSRWALGDLWGAHQAFAQTSAPCAQSGLEATPQRVSVSGSTFAGAAHYADHSWRNSGWVFGAQVGGAWSSRLGVDATVRRVGAQGAVVDASVQPPPGEAPPQVDGTALQTEVWLQVRTQGRQAGVELLVAHARSSGLVDGSAQILGGRGGLRVGPATPQLSAAVSRHDDGRQHQLGLDARFPVVPLLALAGGVQSSRFVPIDAGAEWAWMAWGAVQVSTQDAGLTAELGGRLGEELRPVRWDAPAVWNVDETVRHSAFASVSWRVNRQVSLFAGAERLQLAPLAEDPLAPDTLPESPDPVSTNTPSTVTMAHGGLRVDLGPRATENR